MMPAVTETFTCDSCHETFDKGWSDAEAAAEAEELFPGINPADPAEAGMVCDGCFRHIMGRAHAEAPELIGEGWRGREPEVLEDGSLLYDAVVPGGSFLAGFGKLADEATVLAEAAELGITQEELDREMADMHSTPPGYVPGVGMVSGLAMRMLAESPLFRRAHPDSKCYAMASGTMVHVRPGCRCK
jgi:hypothetical protein